MIFSNDRGSVIDAQFTLHEEQVLEALRCKDWKYHYINYFRVVKEDGKIVKPPFSIKELELYEPFYKSILTHHFIWPIL